MQMVIITRESERERKRKKGDLRWAQRDFFNSHHQSSGCEMIFLFLFSLDWFYFFFSPFTLTHFGFKFFRLFCWSVSFSFLDNPINLLPLRIFLLPSSFFFSLLLFPFRMSISSFEKNAITSTIRQIFYSD